jgi:hypothetical protein
MKDKNIYLKRRKQKIIFILQKAEEKKNNYLHHQHNIYAYVIHAQKSDDQFQDPFDPAQ